MGLSESDFRDRYDHLAKRQGCRLVWDVLDLDLQADRLPYAREPATDPEELDTFADWQS